MQLETDWIQHDVPGGKASAYVARAASVSGPIPGVLVIQELWGVDEHICDLTERFARAGYLAIAPDLYSAPAGGRPEALALGRVATAKRFLNTIEPSQWIAVLGDPARRAQELAKLPDDEARAIDETLGVLLGAAREVDLNVATMRGAFDYLRGHPALGGRQIGSIGYCMGGGLSTLLACREPALAAAVTYYGGPLSAEEAQQIRCPVRGFYGEQDAPILAGLPAFTAGLESAGVDHEMRIYPDTGHAFFNDGRPSYRQEAARDAWARTLAFFAQTLDPVTPV